MKVLHGLVAAIGLVLFLVIMAAGCGETPTADRQGEGGRRADTYEDVTNVTIWRNVDNVPNVATFCAGGRFFASTLSVDGTRTPTLLHLGDC